MRYLTILLILILGVDVKAQKLTLYTYDDKQLHMGATYVISSFTTAYVFKKTQNKRKAMLLGFGMGMGVGVAKELWDIEHGNCEVGDLVADFIGSTLGCLVITIPLP
tara:strand:+ start:76 stop:396 length:321 start_codon:yes stop_codon:yes gene_type:complete